MSDLKPDPSKPALGELSGWKVIIMDDEDDEYASLLRPICQDEKNYVSVGDFAFFTKESKTTRPSLNSTWCVRKNLTRQGKYRTEPFWDAKSKDSDEKISVWNHVPTKNNDFREKLLPLDLGTFRTSNSFNQPKRAEGRVLAVNMTKEYVKFPTLLPSTSYKQIPNKGETFNKTSIVNVTLPITALFPPTDERVLNHLDNPFCKIKKYAMWVVDGSKINDGDGDDSLDVSITVGASSETTESMQHQLGVSLTATTGFSLVQFELNLNYQFTKTRSTTFSSYNSTTITSHTTIPESHYAVFFSKAITIEAFYGDEVEDLYSTTIMLNQQPHAQKRAYANEKRLTRGSGSGGVEKDLPLTISKELCAGKTYIVTGANIGLGLEASRHLVAVGAAKVIMTVRNLEAGEAARADIETSTGIKDVAEVWHLDLASYASVRSFASKVTETLGRIDAIIENAAVATGSDTKAEGHVLTLTVNVISTLLLAVLLLPKLRSDAAKYKYTPRLSIVSSSVAFGVGDYWKTAAHDPIAKMDADPELGMTMYPLSKMLEILAVAQLAKLLPLARGGVIVNTINPGLCDTSLGRNMTPPFDNVLKERIAQFGRTAETGSRTLLAGAMAGEGSHGTYMSDCVTAKESVPEWMDETANKQAWDAIVKELELIAPGAVSRAIE
ncbi:Short-chain dehydrogenase/reductase phmF [Cladobotryum mycophilum]|uniref:Short-chain dehydrogenase/reductase phmF n=1 Tax=Cladobotryum mycophilum TaxID=491253 RepID=A0ABR0SPF8_9HYPO